MFPLRIFACRRRVALPSYGYHRKPVQRLRAAVFVGVICGALAATHSAIAADRPVKIVAFGDSLTAGYGLPAQEAFPAKLEAALKAKGINVEIGNAGVSGDTASGGLARLDWSVPEGTDGVILELGANDALRGIDPKVTRAALEKIVQQLRARKIEVLLCGMRSPRNLGADYAQTFDSIFPDIAASHKLVLYPFFLDGVAVDPKFTLGDGLHPNTAGVDMIVGRILPKTEELIARIRAKPAA